jgi:hypothetical protein
LFGPSNSSSIFSAPSDPLKGFLISCIRALYALHLFTTSSLTSVTETKSLTSLGTPLGLLDHARESPVDIACQVYRCMVPFASRKYNPDFVLVVIKFSVVVTVRLHHIKMSYITEDILFSIRRLSKPSLHTGKPSHPESNLLSL